MNKVVLLKVMRAVEAKWNYCWFCMEQLRSKDGKLVASYKHKDDCLWKKAVED